MEPDYEKRVSAKTIRVTEECHAAHARGEALHMAASIGFGTTLAHGFAISVSELANNLLVHTPDGGTIVIKPLRRQTTLGIEITATDGGPGIDDIARCMQDGFTTGGGLGGGLPAVQRLSSEFEITSTLGQGTRVVARFWKS